MTSSPSNQNRSYCDVLMKSPKPELLWRSHEVTKTRVTVTFSWSHQNRSYYDVLTKSPKPELLWRSHEVTKTGVTVTFSWSHQNRSYYDVLTESPKPRLLWRPHQVTIASTSDCNKSDESSIYCRIIVSMESNVNMFPRRKIVQMTNLFPVQTLVG